MSECRENCCRHCNVMVAPGDPGANQWTEGKQKFLAHHACLAKHDIRWAVERVLRLAELHCDDEVYESLCKSFVGLASYRAVTPKLRMALVAVHRRGCTGDLSRHIAAVRCARELERRLLTGFVACLKGTSSRSCG